MSILWNITYLSTQAAPLSRSQLFDLLEKSRKKNSSLEITGILLYKTDHFMQVLEGSRDAVDELYQTIRLDERHEDVTTLIRERVLTRMFPDWSMGFRNLDQYGPLKPSGFSNILHEPWELDTLRCDSARLRVCLETFVK